ncbi:MAG: phage tail tape measure protein [Halomonas sp.]
MRQAWEGIGRSAEEQTAAARDALDGLDEHAGQTADQTANALDGAFDSLDDAHGQAETAQDSLDGLASTASETGDAVPGHLDGVAAPLEEAETQTYSLQDAFDGIAAAATGGVAGAISAFGGLKSKIAGLIGVGGMGGVVKAASSVEDALASLHAVAPQAAEDLDYIAEAAQAASSASGDYSTAEIIAGIEQLTRAGWDHVDATDQIADVSYLAEAAQTDMGTAAKATANLMAAYGADANEASHYTDLLATYAAQSSDGLAGMERTLGRVVPQAAATGTSFEDITAAMIALDQSGVRARQAGRGVERALTEINDTSGDTQAALSDAGHSVNDFGDLLDLLQDPAVDTEQVIQAFGSRSQDYLRILARDGGAHLQSVRTGFTDVGGRAQEMADITDDTLSGVIGHLRETARVAAQNLGEGLLSPLQRAVERLRDAVRGLVDAGVFERLGQKMAAAFETATEWVIGFLQEFDFEEAVHNAIALFRRWGERLGTIIKALAQVVGFFATFFARAWQMMTAPVRGLYAVLEWVVLSIWDLLQMFIQSGPLRLLGHAFRVAFEGIVAVVQWAYGIIMRVVGAIQTAIGGLMVIVGSAVNAIAGMIETVSRLGSAIGLMPYLPIGDMGSGMMRAGSNLLESGAENLAGKSVGGGAAPRQESQAESGAAEAPERRMVEVELGDQGESFEMPEDQVERMLEALEGAGLRATEVD